MTLKKRKLLDLTGILANHTGSLIEKKIDPKNYAMIISTLNQGYTFLFYHPKTKTKFMCGTSRLKFLRKLPKDNYNKKQL